MKTFKDFEGKSIRLTEERLRHILDHPEMRDKIESIAETLKRPQIVVESLSDPKAHLYYRYYLGTGVGDKYLCAIVKIKNGDAFLLTVYLTDKIKRGRRVWAEKL